MSMEIFLFWQQMNIPGSGGRAELSGELLKIIRYDMPF